MAEPDTITVYYGTEKFQPYQFEPFEIGGLHYTTKIGPNETPEQAFDRAWAFLDNMAKKTYPRKLWDFYARRTTAHSAFRTGDFNPKYE